MSNDSTSTLSELDARAAIPDTLETRIYATDGELFDIKLKKVGHFEFAVEKVTQATQNAQYLGVNRPSYDARSEALPSDRFFSHSSLPLDFAEIGFAYTILSFIYSHMTEARDDAETLSAFRALFTQEKVTPNDWTNFLDFLSNIGPTA